jgi:hypothetical protein
LIGLFALMLVIPAIAFGFGARPVNVEKRRLEPLPTLQFGALADPASFAAMDRYLADSFPFRTDMVEMKSAAVWNLFHASTNPSVVVGEGDWLYFRDAIEPVCTRSAESVLAALDRTAAALRAASVSLRFVVVPDKAAVYPEHAGSASLGDACTWRERDEMRRGMRDRPGEASEAWTPILAEKSRSPNQDLYWHQDTHWSPSGALPVIRQLVIDSGTPWMSEELSVDGTLERTGDLSRLIGLPNVESLPEIAVEPGSMPQRSVLPTAVNTAVGREVVLFDADDEAASMGRTLFVHDSGFGSVVDLIAPWFGDSVWLHYNELERHPEIVSELPPFDAVVVERVERYAYQIDLDRLLAPVIQRARGG